MKLVSRDGQSLELRILGYEFPHLETAEYDSNWLVVAGEGRHPRGSWRFTHPCLLTYEAARLASWMDAAADKSPCSDTCDFTEPNLKFRVLLSQERPVLRVYFNLEARPSWASSRSAGWEDLCVEFPMEEIDLVSAAQQLRAELAPYPQRGLR
ncbi:WapI family immunity protein [Bradyrhizobium diazoefficiens]|uniref:WapI family immunity protein n=1 Tax=Bradyrhizobium diazoefficiens TaxID=1355477 RepID=UPI003D9B15DB